MAKKTASKPTVETVEVDTETTALAQAEIETETDVVNVDDFSSQLAELSATIEQVNEASDDDFEKASDNFWKPSAPNEELRGVYLGSRKQGRLIQHAIGTVNAKGEPVAMRFNGTTTLRHALTADKKGQPCRIVYRGDSKTDGGNRLKLMEVYWLKK